MFKCRFMSKRLSCLFLIVLLLLIGLIASLRYLDFSHVCQTTVSDSNAYGAGNERTDSLESLLEQQETRQSVMAELHAEKLLHKLQELSDKVTLLEKKAVVNLQSNQQLQVAAPQLPVLKQCNLFKANEPDELLQPIHDDTLKYPGVKRKMVVLVTSMRSGSSFIGKMFAESEELMYFFEPFLFLEKLFPQKEREFYDKMKIELLTSMLTCRFDSSKLSFRSIESTGRGAPFPRSWSPTFTQPPFCPKDCPPSSCPPLDVALVNRVCQSRKVLMIKTIRVFDLDILKSAVDNVKGIQDAADLHVLHLIRDPRGTIHSRLKIKNLLERLYKYTHPSEKYDGLALEQLVAANAQWLCEETMSQIQVAERQLWLMKRYVRVRFEDIANDAYGEMKKLYEHYGLEPTEKLIKWIEVYTKGATAHGLIYGTWRKSEAVPFKWREMLKSDKARPFVKIIEEKCRKMMQKLGYVPEFVNFTGPHVE